MTGSVSDPWTRHPALPAQLSQDMDAISTTSYVALPILLLVILIKLCLFLIFGDYFLQNSSCTFPSPSRLYLLHKIHHHCMISTFQISSPIPWTFPPSLILWPYSPCQHPKSATAWGWELHFPRSSCVTLFKAGIHQCTLELRFPLKTD